MPVIRTSQENPPHKPTRDQFKTARLKAQFSNLEKMKNISKRIGLPLEQNSIRRIENGEEPHPPTKDTSPNYPLYGHRTGYADGTNYKSDAFDGALDCYERRFRVFLSLYGAAFFSDGTIDINRNSYFIFQQTLDALEVIEDRDIKAHGLLQLIERFCTERHPPEFKHVKRDNCDRIDCWEDQNPRKRNQQ